jgi:hypothetical protein
MSSPQRIVAARASGARSRGPVTAEGNRHSRRNAEKQGALSRNVPLGGESVDGLQELSARLSKRYQPVGTFERHSVGKVAARRCRMTRTKSFEAASLGRRIGSHPPENPACSAALATHRFESSLGNQYEPPVRLLEGCQEERDNCKTNPSSNHPDSPTP